MRECGVPAACVHVMAGLPHAAPEAACPAARLAAHALALLSGGAPDAAHEVRFAEKVHSLGRQSCLSTHAHCQGEPVSAGCDAPAFTSERPPCILADEDTLVAHDAPQLPPGARADPARPRRPARAPCTGRRSSRCRPRSWRGWRARRAPRARPTAAATRRSCWPRSAPRPRTCAPTA